MTTNKGGGTHPGDPWSPDWQPATPEETPEDEWPYDESLTLSDAELEIAGLEDDDEAEADEGAAEEPEADADLEPAAGAEPETTEEPEADAEADVEPAAAAEPETTEEPESDVEPAAAAEPETTEEPEPTADADGEAAVDAAGDGDVDEVAQLDEAAMADELATDEVPAPELEADEPATDELATEVVEADTEPPAVDVESDTATPEDVVEADAAGVDAVDAAEVDAVVPDQSEVEAEALETEAAETAAGVADAEVAEEALEVETAESDAELVDEVIEVVGVTEPDEVEAELLEGELIEAEVVEAPEIDEGDVEIVDADIVAVDDLDVVPEADADQTGSAETAAPLEEISQTDDLDQVAEFEVIRPSEATPLHAVDDDDLVTPPVEEISVEDLQAEPEWLEAVEEMTLDDIADASKSPGDERTVAEIDAGEDGAGPTHGVDSASDAIDAAAEEPPADETPAVASEPDEVAPADQPAVVIEDATFEVVDIDDADLRADTAEHFFEALNFEADGIDPDAVTAEVPIAAEPEPGPVEAADEFEYDIPVEYDEVAADVDANQQALAAFMAPAQTTADEFPEAPLAEESDRPDEAPPRDVPADQLQILPDLEPADHAEAREQPAPAVTDAAPDEPQPATPEEELIASLTGDLTIPDFESFVEEDFSKEFVAEPTQEHRGLAQTMADSETPELSAVTATMPGVDHGHVGFQEFDDDLHFEDPDAPDDESDGGAELDVTPADVGGSDLTLRVASAVVLVALLAGTLWAGGVTFLIFIAIVAIAAQIEFYAALREGGYRPLVLFGLLGGLGALIGTYAQSTDVLSQGPVAVPAAIGLTVVATFAWYGSQEKPPRDPWRNGMVTVLGVAWIPATLAFVLPMAEASRSDRLQIIIVLLIAVAGFDVGSYFVGRALGKRKLFPVLSPNKTVEGLVGGIIATLIVAVFGAAIVELFTIGDALALALAIIIAAPLGDLAESLIKRSLGIKDMGQLIPGHGGVLDRIDSYLFAVPVAYLVLRWTGLL
ncbi:MAG: phosphatidate cytidylyltransferase [Acidimicrobiia bacterium]|nr:phosphatidate cytidylyltransferase [Acidimicrobiia bacterium]